MFSARYEVWIHFHLFVCMSQTLQLTIFLKPYPLPKTPESTLLGAESFVIDKSICLERVRGVSLDSPFALHEFALFSLALFCVGLFDFPAKRSSC